MNMKLPRKHKNLGKYSESSTMQLNDLMTSRELLWNIMLAKRQQTAPAGWTKKSKMDSRKRVYTARRLRRLPVPPILLLLLHSPEIWMTVAWALSNDRKKVNFCNEEMEVAARKITDPYSCLRDEGALKCTGKLWCRKTVTPPS